MEKNDWILFINAMINIINKDKENAMLFLQKIIKISNDDKLVNNTNKLLKTIKNE